MAKKSKDKSKTSEKIKKGCLKGVMHTLLFTLGSAAFFTIGINFIIASATTAGIAGTIGMVLSMLPIYIIFAAIWIFVAYFIEKSIKKSKVQKEDKEFIEGTHLTKGDLKAILEEGKAKVKEMKKLASTSDYKMKGKIEDIADAVQKIYDNFEEDPKDIKKGKQFLNYYLDATIKILNKYADLTKHKETSEEVGKSLQQVEESLDTIKNAFEKQLKKLVENDVLDVDVELQVLKNTLKAEGLE